LIEFSKQNNHLIPIVDQSELQLHSIDEIHTPAWSK